MSENPFTKLEAQPSFGTKSCIISWELDDDYEGGTFLIRRSPDGERNIEIIKSDLSWQTLEYTDEEFFLGNRTGKFYYQVILRYEDKALYSGFVSATGRKSHITESTVVTQEEEQQEDIVEQLDDVLEEVERVEPTAPAQTLLPLNRDLGIIQQINKLELLRMRHRGTRCALLKPKKVGELSHEGLDQDTGQELNPYGEDRFGQKYVGGFEEPICTYMFGRIKRIDLLKPVQTGEGQTDKYIYQVRMVSQPQVKLDDIVVDLHDDSRYSVRQVDNYQLRGVYSVVSDVQVVLISRSNAVYKFPVSCPDLTPTPTTSGASGTTPVSGTTTVTGVVYDGLIEGATITKNDEFVALTDSTGSFTATNVVLPVSFKAAGGTDKDTGLVNTMPLELGMSEAASEPVYITPITTLVAAVKKQDATANESEILAKLGIQATSLVELIKVNPANDITLRKAVIKTSSIVKTISGAVADTDSVQTLASIATILLAPTATTLVEKVEEIVIAVSTATETVVDNSIVTAITTTLESSFTAVDEAPTTNDLIAIQQEVEEVFTEMVKEAVDAGTPLVSGLAQHRSWYTL